jgi:hypothetical protein
MDSQRLDSNLFHYYLLMSRFWDKFAAEMLSTIANYPIRQVYVTPNGWYGLPSKYQGNTRQALLSTTKVMGPFLARVIFRSSEYHQPT